MGVPMRIEPDTSPSFPVSQDHPLAKAQSFRAPTLADISSHPVYSKILETKTAQLLSAYPVSEQTANLKSSLQNSVHAHLAATIGPIHQQKLSDINITGGQTVTYNGNWHEVTAESVRIAPGGVIRVMGTDASVSATFVLNCQSFGS